MKEINPNLENDGQFKLDLQGGPEVITSNYNEQQDDVTHLSQDDLDELATIDPVTHKAIMVEIEQQRESIEKRKELEDIEQRVAEVEAVEALEIAKNKEDALRASIVKAYENENENDFDEERDDKTGGYRHFAEIAREEQQNKDKKIIKGIKKGKRKWNKNWDSIARIFKRDNLR